MDLANIDFDMFMIGPLFLLMLGLAGMIWIAMLGTSLKYSIEIFVDEGPRYWVCLLASFLLIGINVAVFIGLYWAVGPQPWYIVAAYQLMLQMLLVMLLARCNPFSAFLAAATHGVISSAGTFVIALVFFLAYFFAVGNAVERNKEVAETIASPAQPSAISTNPFVD